MIESFIAFQDAQTIHCNPPVLAEATIPVTLLHPAFSQFLDDCETLQTTPKDNRFAVELHFAMSEFHTREDKRAKVIGTVFSQMGLGFGFFGNVTDGLISENGRCCAIAQFRGEVGGTEIEPYNQSRFRLSRGDERVCHNDDEFMFTMHDHSCVRFVLSVLVGHHE